MSISEKNRVVNTILAIVLVLFASLVAPKLPRSITKYLENPLSRFVIFVAIAYLATQDLVTAVIATIAVLVSYQTLAVQQITDNVMNKTKQMLQKYNSNNGDYDQTISLDDVLMGSSDVLMGSDDVLMGSDDVLMGSGDVLMGSGDVLMGSDDVLMGSMSYDPNMSGEPVIDSVPSVYYPVTQVDERSGEQLLPIDNNMVPQSDNIPLTNCPYKQTIKYLKGNSSELPTYYDESDVNAGSIENNSTLTESCSIKHTTNFACSNIPKMDSVTLSGYENDYDNHEQVVN